VDLSNKSDEEILKAATPIMDNLMQGSTECNWNKHTKHFTEKGKSVVTKTELERQCKEYQSMHGNFAERELIGITRHPKYINVLWKQQMTKSTGEYLATLTLVQNGESYLVARCWVDLWEPL
jgi:hypothetical protein